ncbi:hypothetical protein MPLSOD_410062 [Mesorhizobium sp. SOD10]|nr:hypothetical protein MPLSOD_410062 [Mesorhizobium sp. SOD10]
MFNDVVCDVSCARFAMRVEILGAERRRRWGDRKKLDIVMSVGIDGATVTEVAERHDVTRQQIYTWRRELRRKRLLLPWRAVVSSLWMRGCDLSRSFSAS